MTPLFLKDVGLYHVLLGKVSQRGNVNCEERKEAIVCLAQLLNASGHISKLLSKNVRDLQEVYKIPLHILLYLFSFGEIESHRQMRVLEGLLELLKESGGSNKRARYYLSRLVGRLALNNYRIISFYENS